MGASSYYRYLFRMNTKSFKCTRLIYFVKDQFPDKKKYVYFYNIKCAIVQVIKKPAPSVKRATIPSKTFRFSDGLILFQEFG